MTALFLTVPDAAKRLGIGRSLLYRLIASGQITMVKVGRRTLIPIDAVESFAREACDQGTVDPDFKELRRGSHHV